MPSFTKKINFNKMRFGFFFGLIFILAITFLYLIRPFLFPIFWAGVVAVMFYPLYLWLNKHLRLPGPSAGITIVFVIILIFLPLFFISFLLVQESADLYQKIAAGNFFGKVGDVAIQLRQTSLGPLFETVQTQWTKYAASAAQAISVFVFQNIKEITQNSIRFVFMAFIMLYTLYYFLKDGKKMLKYLMQLSPLGDKYEIMLYERFTSTARATLKGTLIIGIIQGTLGGILFWFTGVEGALVWGVIMMVLSLIPAIGSFIVWAPAGIVMLAVGNIWQGVTILIVGTLVISMIDNVLRPPLVGKDTQMHPLFVLFSTLGGIILFGVSGFVIGPIITALFLSIISIYSHYYKNELQNN